MIPSLLVASGLAVAVPAGPDSRIADAAMKRDTATVRALILWLGSAVRDAIRSKLQPFLQAQFTLFPTQGGFKCFAAKCRFYSAFSS
jgi:hypothetical protein